MPRQAPNQVIEHRLSLQDKEREAIIPLINDIQSLTEKVAFTSEVYTYGALALGGVAIFYVPQVWKHVREQEGGFGLPGATLGERFKWVVRWSPAGIIKNTVEDILGLTGSKDDCDDGSGSGNGNDAWEDFIGPIIPDWMKDRGGGVNPGPGGGGF